MMKQIVWIVGASSGIGLALAKRYLRDGERVIISARDTQNSQNLKHLKQEYADALTLIDIDVTQNTSVREATQRAWNIYGGIDLCVYNAGIYESMRLEQWNLDHFHAMNDVNYMGAVRFLHEMVPLFLEQRQGHIAFNASISSYFGLPYGGAYSAPKAALLNLCESIYPELRAKNIYLQVINHGFVKSRLTAKNDFAMPQLLEPQEAAEQIHKGLLKPQKFEIKFPWALTSFLQLLRLLPYRVAFALTKKAL
jgi:short-subunit dehydrogenase